ncbi:MAG: alkaline phosphatase [Clostridia bacterium]|nr:alkaline phosphatase [Clostridia bacterium]
MLKKITSLILAVGLFGFTVSCKAGSDTKPKEIKNVILLIGDGMGPNQIRAGELYKERKLFMQTIEQSVKVNTYSVYGDITDSAAAATALATGTSTKNGVVGRNTDLVDLETIVDIAHGLGKRTGVITTEELYGATPMGFSSHSDNRNYQDELLITAAQSSNVNLFASYKLSSSKQYMVGYFTENGYKYVENADEISECTEDKIIGFYDIHAQAEPMTIDPLLVSFDGLISEALEYLAKDEDGFFLMAEGAHIDHGGHNNDIEYMLRELLSFDDMVRYVVEWASKRDDTLVIVTADHETGGLEISDEAQYGELFDYYRWTSKGHTGTDVWLFAYGDEIDFKSYSTFESEEQIKNIDVFSILKAYVRGEA